MTYVAAEMRRLKLDTQKAMDNNLESLKQQVDDDKRIKEQMAKDIANLEDKMRKFAAQNKELEGQVSAQLKCKISAH